MSRATVTAAELRALTTTAGGKFHSRKTWVEELSRWFDSALEASAAVTLYRRQQAGEIRGLAFQVKYPIEVNDEHVCDYYADYVFEEHQRDRDTSMGEAWVTVVADAKSPPTRTAVYRLKKRLLWAVAGIRIREM